MTKDSGLNGVTYGFVANTTTAREIIMFVLLRRLANIGLVPDIYYQSMSRKRI